MKFSSCIILQSGESSTPFNKNDRVYFSGEKKWNETIQGIHFFWEYTKKLQIKSHPQSLPHSPISRSPVGHFGLLYVSGKLPTYPSPKPTFCPKWELSVNVGLGEG